MPWRGVWPKVAIPAVSSRIEAPGGGEHRAAHCDPVRATGYENLGVLRLTPLAGHRKERSAEAGVLPLKSPDSGVRLIVQELEN